MKKIVLLISCTLICIYGLSENKIQKDTVVYFNEYEVIDKNIYNLLDTAIIHELSFFRRNCTYNITLYKEHGQLKLSIGFLDEELLKYYNSWISGYTKYKGSLFFISSYPNAKKQLKNFFRTQNNRAQFTFQYYSGEMGPIVDETGWYYFYKNGKFVFDYLFDTRIATQIKQNL
jgi:hypothetical protein